MLAEISQQLEECSIDECPTIATSVHYVEIYSTFCAHANNVIGPHWRGGVSGGNNTDDQNLTLPSNMKGLKCGVAGCDKSIDFTKLSKGQKQRIIKKAEGEWSNAGDNKDTPCFVCVKKLKDDAIQCDKLILKNGKAIVPVHLDLDLNLVVSLVVTRCH